jgi:hypothetical protein
LTLGSLSLIEVIQDRDKSDLNDFAKVFKADKAFPFGNGPILYRPYKWPGSSFET